MRRHALTAAAVCLLIAAGCQGRGGDPGASPSSVDPSTDASTFPSTADAVTTTTIEATTGSSGAPAAPPPRPGAPPTATGRPSGSRPPALGLEQLTPVEAGTAIATRAGDNSVYITEQAGVIRGLRDGRLDPAPVLDLTDLVLSGGERGLLGLAFSADGATLYAYWTAKQPLGEITIASFPMGPTAADRTGQQVLITVPHAKYGNHNGGILMRGPDGFLYAGIGDGGSGGDPDGNGQNPGTLLGTIIRIDPTKPADGRPYGIPPGNPFAAGGGRPEVWAYGLRNPWRISFDPASATLWTADVGQNAFEEINRVPAATAGVNYGWRNREGLHPYKGGDRPAGAVDPVAELNHDAGFCSITGGYVYRGKAIPGLVGRYVFADYCVEGVRTLSQQDGAWVVEKSTAAASSVRTFGVDPAGELLLIDNDGLKRIVPR